ncbi:MAG: response regulator transcription factor, partial [Deltaproteobacteria bacterium]|nr:response regulator transcription factor [Deltaproteobacteria bacterium]
MKLEGLIRIYLVDDHPVFRLGLAGLLRAEPKMQLEGETDSGRQALEEIPSKKIDIVVLDLSLQDMSGLDLIRELRREKKDDFSILV